MPTAWNASTRSSTLPVGTSRPARRNTRANATAASSSVTGHRTRDERVGAVGAHALLVLAVLDDGAQRRVDRALVHLGPAERGERLGPVDRLRDTRRLVELEVAQRADGRGHLAGQALDDLGGPQPHD